MLRFYFSEIIGTGVPGDNDPLRPAFDATGLQWSGVDMRWRQNLTTGHFFVWSDVSDAQHATIIADARNAWLPFANNAGALPITATVGDLSTARRNQCRTLLETHHIPIDDFTNATVLRRVVARVVRRTLLRSAMSLRYANSLVADTADFSEGLDTLVSAMNATKRTALSDRLSALGYDTGAVLGTDTIRAALMKLLEQGAAYNTNPWD